LKEGFLFIGGRYMIPDEKAELTEKDSVDFNNNYKIIFITFAIISIALLFVIIRYIIKYDLKVEFIALMAFFITIMADTFMLWKFINIKLIKAETTIEKLNKENVGLREESTLDNLTGAFNRRKLEEILAVELERCNRYGTSLSMVIMDIDDFKKINDKYGHSRGDIVLKNISKVVSSKLRKTDFFVRWGGEEFVIIAPETKIQGALKLGEKLRKLISENIYVELERVTVSIGVAEYEKGTDYERLFDKADKALYIAKNSGKNNVKFVE
jgi:diguanylate cyclase (GGDEF)-like protein